MNKYLNSFEVRQKLPINMFYFKISSLEISIFFYILKRFLYFEWTVAKFNLIVGVNRAAMAFQGHDFNFRTWQNKVDLNPFIKKYKFLVYKNTHTCIFNLFELGLKIYVYNNSKKKLCIVKVPLPGKYFFTHGKKNIFTVLTFK